MKVRITRMYFDGLRRHRVGSVINISDKKFTKASEIPTTSKKKVGDYIYFAPSCMEMVSNETALLDVPRPIPGLTVEKKSSADDSVKQESSSKETLADSEVI